MKTLRAWWNKIRRTDEIVLLNSKLNLSDQAFRGAVEDAHLLKLEVADLKRRLATEREAYDKSRKQVVKLAEFIALRHRLSVPAANGSIRQTLQEAERR